MSQGHHNPTANFDSSRPGVGMTKIKAELPQTIDPEIVEAVKLVRSL
jgi:hypothetical protein